MVGTSHSEDKKRLAKNTLVLYLRTAIVMFVQLFVTRLVLQSLGADDFGIFNVVGSMVVLFTFISSAMASSSQRFINYELGRGTHSSVNKVFSASMTTQIVMASLLVVIIEIIGLWLLNSRLNIPQERTEAAKWVFHFAMVIFFVNTVRVPYEGSVIAYERMSFFAYASIIDVILKLIIALSLRFSGADRLVTYGGLLMAESIAMFFVYRYFCKSRFKTCQYRIVRDGKLYRQLFSYIGWTVLGSGANVLTHQGFVFMINIFYGVAVNAALGIANQVNTAIVQFVNSFQISYRPQIVSSYAKDDIEHLNRLVSLTSKYSFALMIIPSTILIFNMPLILKLWLSEVPAYCVEFCQAIIICTVIDAISGSYNAAIMATSKIRNYQIAISASFMLDLLFSFALIKMGVLPYLVIISRIATRGVLNMIIGLKFMSSLVRFDVGKYLRDVIFPIAVILVSLTPFCLYLYSNTEGWTMFCLSSLYVTSFLGLSVYFCLLSKSERAYLKETVLSKIGCPI